MPKVTLGHRIRYTFDNLMSKGAVALIFYLVIISGVLIAGVAAFDTIANLGPDEDAPPAAAVVEQKPAVTEQTDKADHKADKKAEEKAEIRKPDEAATSESKPEEPKHVQFSALLWRSLMRTLDAGNLDGDNGSAGFIASMFLVTLGGIFIVSTLVGVLSSGIDQKLEELRKGKSFVVENNHTLILGWSENIFTVISEVCESNRSRGKACIVILAQKDKVEMDDEIKARITSPGKTRIVTRTGNPIDFVDLDIANPHQARSIVVLSGEGGDPETIKTVLAIVNNPNRRKEPYHIVAQLQEHESVQICKMIGKTEVKTVLTPEIIARIMVQTCRQPGLSVVYTELLDFGGDEIYLKEEKSYVGQTYGQLVYGYEKAAIMGIIKKDGQIKLNPATSEKFESGDRIIAIAEDDDRIIPVPLATPPVNSAAIRTGAPMKPVTEKTLLLGHNARTDMMLEELDQYVAPGSTVTAVTDGADGLAEYRALGGKMKNQKVSVIEGLPTNRHLLDEITKENYDHIITVSDTERLSAQQADANTLISLLHLRDIASKSGRTFTIVSEMLDNRNRELAEVTGVNDFIVSDKLISLMMSQISESPELSEIFEELFTPDGNEIYLKPASDYVVAGQPINFHTVIQSALSRNETAIGYRVLANSTDPSKQYGVRVNPPKSELITFAPGDRVIVLSES